MARREAIERELADLRERSNEMKAHWRGEKEAIEAIRQAKEQLEQAHRDTERAERDADLQRAAELRYGEIPPLKELVKDDEARLAGIQADRTSSRRRWTTRTSPRWWRKWTGIPVSKLMEGEVAKLVHMEERLHERVIGQDEAVEAVSNAVRRSRAGLQDPNRPIGSFLFLGPTGVGKTELARALAEFLFDDEQAMVRIDMSEYMEKHSVSRLVGAPPGYVGYEEGGQLTEAVRRRPYTVVLLDEIEKAHPDVFNILLQLLDDGRLTDGQGRTVDFKNTVVIMTSNVAGGIEGVRATFKPEFVNRLDEIVQFDQLTREEIGEIVELQVAKLVERVREKGVEVELSDEARTLIGNLGYDPTYGARPLKRVIQKRLVDRLALKLLDGEFGAGDHVRVDADEGDLSFAKALPRPSRHQSPRPAPARARPATRPPHRRARRLRAAARGADRRRRHQLAVLLEAAGSGSFPGRIRGRRGAGRAARYRRRRAGDLRAHRGQRAPRRLRPRLRGRPRDRGRGDRPERERGRPARVRPAGTTGAGRQGGLRGGRLAGDPRTAREIPFRGISFPSQLGPMPAWRVEGRGSTWAIFVHGHNATRREGLRVLGSLRSARLPSLLIAYRNDPGAPPSRDGLLHLGATEWRDVESAARYALARGARSFVLLGDSMGGAIVSQFVHESPLAKRVRALVLDAPVLDWKAVVDLQADERGLPRFLGTTTEWAVSRRIEFDWDAFDQVARAREFGMPILLFHGTEDTTVPISTSEAFARALPRSVQYHRVPGAGHVESWNVNPRRYDRLVREFLATRLAG